MNIKFLHINLGNNKINDLDVSIEYTFSQVINLFKTKYKDFKLVTFNELFYYEKEEKKIFNKSRK